MEIISRQGRTAIVYRVGRDSVCKVPRSKGSERLIAEIDNAFVVERELLQMLGVHPRIVQYVPISTTMQF